MVWLVVDDVICGVMTGKEGVLLSDQGSLFVIPAMLGYFNSYCGKIGAEKNRIE